MADFSEESTPDAVERQPEFKASPEIRITIVP
jgi:hypothetical protein